ncbi:MAG: hypothetical protein GTO17_04540 [Candidatus Aminicenantes bacterium]|nr:hypothetical protein [Candidatus Aminicenantes bacterium]
MQELSLTSQVILYVLLGIMGLMCPILWGWQIMVLKGKPMKNPDGSFDSWHNQKTHYGIALADVFLACPVNIAGIVLVFVSPRWGFYLLALVSFWWVWANTMTTTTSLRFEKPKMTLTWLITYPLGILVGLVYIMWTIVHFDTIYSL